MGDRLRDILWSLKGTGYDNTFLTGFKRSKGISLTKIVLIKFNFANICDTLGIFRRLQAHRKNNHIVGFKLVLTIQGGIGQFKMILPRGNVRDFGSDKLNANGLSPFPCRIKIFAMGSDIHIIDGNINIRIVLFCNKGLFDGIHTTNI